MELLNKLSFLLTLLLSVLTSQDTGEMPVRYCLDCSYVTQEEQKNIEYLSAVIFEYAAQKEPNLVLPDSSVLTYVKWANNYAEQYNFDVLWILSMIWQESRYKADAISPAGAVGLMQIMPSTGKQYGVTKQELKDPETNIRVGIKHLAYLRDELYNGDIRMATIAYNQGEGNVKRGKYRTWYHDSVKKHYTEMKEIYRRIREGL